MAFRSPLDYKEIQPVHPKGNQSKIFIGRTDAEAETPILWPPDVKNWLIWKDPDAGKDWRQEEKGTTEDEMGVGDGQGGLACCSPWGHKELDRAEWLNWTEWLMMFRLFLYAYWPLYIFFSGFFQDFFLSLISCGLNIL